jgi:recombination protein RecR
LFEPPIADLISQLSRLPSIGSKTAQRIVFHLLKGDRKEIDSLIEALASARDSISICTQCFNYAAGDLCSICSNPRRDKTVICVVESPQDVLAIERTGTFLGLYHVLGGSLNPIEGIGPEQLKIGELVRRVDADGVKEVVVATNPNVEGETTAMYIAKTLRPKGVVVTRLASGLPVGSDLEYADELTLGRAFEWRREVE